jgi:hypothetical protein
MKSIHIKNSQLWPSTLYVGSTVIKFLLRPEGKVIKVESHGDNAPRPRHKRLPKNPRKRYNRSR